MLGTEVLVFYVLGSESVKVAPMTRVIAMTYLVTALPFSVQVMLESCLMVLTDLNTSYLIDLSFIFSNTSDWSWLLKSLCLSLTLLQVPVQLLQSNLDYSKRKGPQESFRIIGSSNDRKREFSDIFGKTWTFHRTSLFCQSL